MLPNLSNHHSTSPLIFQSQYGGDYKGGNDFDLCECCLIKYGSELQESSIVVIQFPINHKQSC